MNNIQPAIDSDVQRRPTPTVAKPKSKSKMSEATATLLHEQGVAHFFPNVALTPTDTTKKALWTSEDGKCILAHAATWSDINKRAWFGITLSHIKAAAAYEDAYLLLSMATPDGVQHFCFPASVKDGILHVVDYPLLPDGTPERHQHLYMKRRNNGQWYVDLGQGNTIDAACWTDMLVRVLEHWRTLPTRQQVISQTSDVWEALAEWTALQINVLNEMRPPGQTRRARLVFED